MITEDEKRMLEKEIPVLTREIKDLYQRLDKQLNLNGAGLAIDFGFENDALGHYMPSIDGEDEYFHFSLVFIGYVMEKQISKEERENLYKHEYAHYMVHHLDIPYEYKWQPGPHGSAFKYCCALINVTPSRYFKSDENLEPDYTSHLKKPSVNHQTVRLIDNAHQKASYEATKNRKLQYEIGEIVEHPKFGVGVVEGMEQTGTSVRLTIRFGDEVKEIDQKWLVKTKYKRAGDR